MLLPKMVDGRGQLSYSQIATFRKSKEEYYRQRVLNEPFEGNIWTHFGQEVETAIENYDENSRHSHILPNITRLSHFQVPVTLEYEGFDVRGYIDTTDFRTLVDYKTGGKNKIDQYRDPSYIQLQIYALGLLQEGIEIKEAYVEFIERVGNPYRGQMLSCSGSITRIPIDVSSERLEAVRQEVLEVAQEISEWYMSLPDDYLT